MKKLLITVICALAFQTSWSQKIGYVDSEYILKHVPEYASAQRQLDDLSANWQKEIDKKYDEIDKLYKSYQAEQILLSEDMRKNREQEIVDKEKAAKDFQKLKFGFEGELFQKRKDLVKPVQDKIYNAIQKVAEEGAYGFLFDKNSDLIMIYSSPKYDKSDDVITKMGYKPGQMVGGNTNKPANDVPVNKTTVPAGKTAPTTKPASPGNNQQKPGVTRPTEIKK